MILMDCPVIPDQGGDGRVAMTKLVQRWDRCMRPKFARLPLVLLFSALSLAACATRNDVTPTAGLSEDDDTFCRAGGKVAVGSPDYVYCRKDRDAQRNAAVARSDRKQRDLAEYMMNNPTRP